MESREAISKVSLVLPLQAGDFLFQRRGGKEVHLAIETSARGYQNFLINHLGICQSSTSVIEARDPLGVQQISLEEFLSSAQHDEWGRPLVLIGRLKATYRHLIPTALAKMEQKIGAPYNVSFLDCNDQFYCSQLVTFAFGDLFPLQTMSFKDASGHIHPYWQNHYQKMNLAVPEGQLGSHPARISRSDKLDILLQLGNWGSNVFQEERSLLV